MSKLPPKRKQNKRRIFPVCPSCRYYAGVSCSTVPGNEETVHDELVAGYFCRRPEMMQSTIESAAFIEGVYMNCLMYEDDDESREKEVDRLREENAGLKDTLDDYLEKYSCCLDEIQRLKDTPKTPAAKNEKGVEDLGFDEI